MAKIAPQAAKAPSALDRLAQLQEEAKSLNERLAHVEAELRAGNPKVQGLCLALSDWSAELKILERLPWKTTLSDPLSPPSGASS
jgi:hypothetical protein